jgi:hypothetical protein
MNGAGRRSLIGLTVVGLLVGTWLVYPALRGLAWVHLRTTPPEHYVLPLPGLQISELEPNFGAPRSHGPHEGVDIVAPAGTPVLAVADGVVIRNRSSSVGGIVLWVQGADRRLYYYAHMQELAPGMRRGSAVRAGERIGSVGNTGNASNTPPHLHFAIYRVTSNGLPLRYRPLDPYRLLVAAGRPVEAAAPERAEAPPPPPRELAPPFDPGGSDVLMADTVATRAEAAASRLAAVLRSLDPFLAADADGDVRRVPRLYALAERVRARATVLRESAAGDRPLAEQSSALRATGRRLDLQRQRLDGLLDWYEVCAPRARAAFLGGLETLALDLERDAGFASGPRLDYAFFAGLAPDLVPVEGGWLGVVGRDLWPGRAPEVELRGANAERLAALTPHPLDGETGFVVYVGSSLLAGQAGRCVSLRWRAGPSSDEERTLPLCVPASYRSGYRVAGYLAYRLPLATRALETDEILFTNSSCDEPREVTRTLEWQLEPDGRLVETGEFELFTVHESSVDCRIDANRVTCSGWLAPARCDDERRVDSEWHHIFSPIEEYPDRELHRSAVISPFVSAAASVTRRCVEMRRNDESEETAMWFDVFVQNAEQQEHFFSSPREVTAGPTTAAYAHGAYRIEAELDPASRPGEASMCVTIRAPECSMLGGG